MNTNKLSAVISAKAFREAGGRYVVISPGSRNAPLIKSFQNEDLQLLSIVDERSAGFIALGIAQSTGGPVALCCTSGSALLNYSPAVAEAFYAGINLIVFSADRPQEFIDQGIGQTIQQQGVYQNFQKGFLQLPLDVLNENLLFEEISCLLEKGKQGFKGPIHVNIPFDEPLYGEAKFLALEDRSSNDENARGFNSLSETLLAEFYSTRRVLIICGVLAPSSELNEALDSISRLSNIALFSEYTSNLSISHTIKTIDRVLELSGDSDEPDLVITLGENIISKKIKSFVSSSNAKHWHVNEGGIGRDIFGKLSETINANAGDFLNSLNTNKQKIDSGYKANWENKRLLSQRRHDQYFGNCVYSDLYVFEQIVNVLPSNYHIQSGNSSVVRYFQLFDNLNSKSFYANRGTSGIDGSTSTAVGFCHVVDEPTLLVTGDLSFMYDSNGLWNNIVSAKLRIIIINNAGGGIFRIIPGPDTVENFETFFEGNHSMNFRGIIENMSLDYGLAKNESDLNHALQTFFDASDVAKVLEVQTPNEINSRILKEYFSFIKNGDHA